jgi:putative transcriptional regulator
MDLSGKFLVAPPTMRDWRFAQTVVYLWKHDLNGASGVIINRPVESSRLIDICRDGNIRVGEGIDSPIHHGGPIGENIVGCLHTLDYKMGCTNLFGDSQLGFTMERKIIEDIAIGKGPDKYLITVGMCHWGPGQLETEIEANPPRSKKESWLVMDYDPNLVFTEHSETLWNQCVNISVAENSRSYLDKFFQ